MSFNPTRICVASLTTTSQRHSLVCPDTPQFGVYRIHCCLRCRCPPRRDPMRDLAVSGSIVLPPPPVVPLPRDDTGEVNTDVSGFVNVFLFPLKCPHFGRWVLTAVRAFGRLREPYKGRYSLLTLRAHPQGCVLYGWLPTHGQSQRTRHRDLDTPR